MDSGRLQAKYVPFLGISSLLDDYIAVGWSWRKDICMILDEGYLYGPSYYRGCQPGFVGVEKHGFTMVAIVWIDNGLHGRSINMRWMLSIAAWRHRSGSRYLRCCILIFAQRSNGRVKDINWCVRLFSVVTRHYSMALFVSFLFFIWAYGYWRCAMRNVEERGLIG